MKSISVSEQTHRRVMDGKNADSKSADAVINTAFDLNDKIVKTLIQFCGETGDNEGAADTLERIVKELKDLRGKVKKIDQNQ